MFLFIFVAFVTLYMPAAVIACEGECITGTADKLCSKYTGEDGILTKTVKDIDCGLQESLSPDSSCTGIAFLNPILQDVRKKCDADMTLYVFKNHFHGRCQNAKGEMPPGCPNPDCHVLCGTPGSMVHFYESDLVPISNKAVVYAVRNATDEHSSSFKESQKLWQKASPPSGRSTAFRFKRTPGIFGLADLFTPKQPTPDDTLHPSSSFATAQPGSEDFVDATEAIEAQLQSSCGKDLTNCSWGKEMKEYILGFP